MRRLGVVMETMTSYAAMGVAGRSQDSSWHRVGRPELRRSGYALLGAAAREWRKGGGRA
jgi:hypothetical protein